VNCGGIAEKNPFVMQIYADVTGRPIRISRSGQTCALGAAIAGAVVAGKKSGGFDNYSEAQAAMTGLKPKTFQPAPKAHAVYQKLYGLYRKLHDSFGTQQPNGSLYPVMKELIQIRNEARA
jgi:L-ribulokinase